MAGLGQPGRVDVEVFRWAIGAGYHQLLAKSDELQRLFGQHDLRIVPTRPIYPDDVVSDGLKKPEWYGIRS
jgi:hypothetical protein